MELSHTIQTIALYAIPVIFAITIHEAAHGYAARHFGDDTAWRMGRITLNPLKHIEWFGTLLLPLMLVLAGLPALGSAKPVPVRFGNLRNPKRDMVWVALAGPASNLLQALVWQAALMILWWANVSEPFLLGMCKAGVVVNQSLFAFNLFPLPPLDGGRILVGILPLRQAQWVARIEPWGFMIVLGILLVVPWIYGIWMQPVMALGSMFIQTVLAPLSLLLR